jgi:hypothetical protein
MKASFSRNNGKSKHKNDTQISRNNYTTIIHRKIFASEFHFSDIEKLTGEPKARKSYIFTKFTKGKKYFPI